MATLGLGAAAACTGGRKTEKPIEGQVIRHYPGTGLLGYGCMRWPEEDDGKGGKRIIQEEVNRLVDEALAHGINYFDTSPVYHDGDSERATAEALCRHPRETWQLATKLSLFRKVDYDAAVAMYRRSLELFQTDYIDYYLLHALMDGASFEERFVKTGVLDFLLAEREAGRIRKLGFSFHGSREGFDALLAQRGKYHWDFVQIQMNYLDWRHAGGRNTNADYMYAALAALDIPVVIMEPLRGGDLATLPASLEDRLKAHRPEASVASWAFRFAGSFPKVLAVLSGMTYREHLEDNLLTYIDFEPLSDDEFALLEEIAEQIGVYPKIRCTGCRYCMPCPYGIDIPGLFKFYNSTVDNDTYLITPEQKDFERARRRYMAAYDKAVQSAAQADRCIGCAQCVSLCPQHIPIPGEIRRIDRLIETLRQA